MQGSATAHTQLVVDPVGVQGQELLPTVLHSLHFASSTVPSGCVPPLSRWSEATVHLYAHEPVQGFCAQQVVRSVYVQVSPAQSAAPVPTKAPV